MLSECQVHCRTQPETETLGPCDKTLFHSWAAQQCQVNRALCCNFRKGCQGTEYLPQHDATPPGQGRRRPHFPSFKDRSCLLCPFTSPLLFSVVSSSQLYQPMGRAGPNAYNTTRWLDTCTLGGFQRVEEFSATLFILPFLFYRTLGALSWEFNRMDFNLGQALLGNSSFGILSLICKMSNSWYKILITFIFKYFITY